MSPSLSKHAGTHQYAVLASHTVKIFAFASQGRRSSTTGTGYIDLFRALLRGLGSRQRRSFPFFFFSTTRADIHSVGSESLAITPIVPSLSNSAFTSSLSASGSRPAGTFTEETESLISRCTYSAMHPMCSLNTFGYCTSTAAPIRLSCCRLLTEARCS